MHKSVPFLILCSAALAQPQAPPDRLVSPEVHPDRTVTFHIRAPKAAQVTLFGSWMAPGSQVPMTKDAEGVWSLTLGPLEASMHLYSFTVDGVTIADPVNPKVKLRQRTSGSMLEIPATPPALWEARNVPHGTVEVNWQASSVIGDTRQIYVYLPPGYERSKSRYPVLYLFHGTGDVAESWIQAGHANLILDSLIAEQKAKPMIVVMPLGHATPFWTQPYDYVKNMALFDDYLLKEVIPWAESKYRVTKGRQNRAIAGLSMGGSQAATIGFAHLDVFSSIGIFSSSAGKEFVARFEKTLADHDATNKQIRTLWIGIGKQDGFYANAEKFSDLLKQQQIRHTFESKEGFHTWAVWRWCLGEFAPLLFQ